MPGKPSGRVRARGAPQGSRLPDPLPDPVTLTVVMPVYNEHETVATAIERVLGVTIPNVTLDLLIVESNSTDGTREIVQRFASTARVKVIHQAAPRGKGHAVREGFAHATGSIILIQDADLEYRVEDYGALLQPIIDRRADFVLGSRHAEGEPIRNMPDERVASVVTNFGHVVFLALFNATYRTKLRDPFTMYKVLRAECLENLSFVANRFDFDWEIVAKLVRLGFAPLEVPITYQARGFRGGKKVRLFRDPLTWIVACFRFRFSRLRTKAVVAAPDPPESDDYERRRATTNISPMSTSNGRSRS